MYKSVQQDKTPGFYITIYVEVKTSLNLDDCKLIPFRITTQDVWISLKERIYYKSNDCIPVECQVLTYGDEEMKDYQKIAE